MSDNVPEAPVEPTAPEPTPEPEAPKAEETDWKAMARKWEKLAKENSKATEELDKLKKSQMTEQEKAVAEAKAAGASEASKTYGSRLAAAELKAAAAAKGINLSALDGLIDASRFVGEDGEVDTAAISKAVDKIAKAIPSGPQRGGADFNGGNGAGQITREQLASMTPSEIAKAHADGKLNHLM